MAVLCPVSPPTTSANREVMEAFSCDNARRRQVLVDADVAAKYERMAEKHRESQRRLYERKKAQLAEATERAKKGEPLEVPEFFVRQRKAALKRYHAVVKPAQEKTKELRKSLAAQWDLEHGDLKASKKEWIKQQLAVHASLHPDVNNALGRASEPSPQN